MTPATPAPRHFSPANDIDAPEAEPDQPLASIFGLAKVYRPRLSVGLIRSDLYHSQSNGLAAAGALFKRGGKLLIDSQRYRTWRDGLTGATP